MTKDCSECKHFDELHTSRTCHDCKPWGASTDLIRRADAIEAVRFAEHRFTVADEQHGMGTVKWDMYGVYTAEAVEAIKALPSAEPHNKDAISREGLLKSWEELSPRGRLEFDQVIMTIPALPSAEADGEDLIIKGAKGIQDGLYNIKDGKLFKYKANGGTVRTYPIVPSADAVSREECDKCQIKLIQSKMADKIDELKKQLADSVHWIPIEKGSPNNDEDVIVSVLDDHGDTPWKYTTVAWLCNEVWISDNEVLCGSVIAWMPLPKPYERDARTENKE